MKEAAHQRRIQELEEHKRHSWAGGEQVGGLGLDPRLGLDPGLGLEVRVRPEVRG